MTSGDAGPRDRLFLPWVLLACACAFLMWQMPGEETIPYHLAWIAIALGYGLEAWPWARTIVAVAAYTLVTGCILVVRALTGVVDWQETAEIPLMAVLLLIVVWNVRRRHLAFASLTDLAGRDRALAARRQRLSAMTSHEMRTPATIATGYTEKLLREETDESRRADLGVIRDELGRLVLAGDRIVRTLRMHDADDVQQLDLEPLLTELAQRWSVLADRDWVVTCEPVRMSGSVGRLRACLDTLVENAVRYTEPGDVVRIVGRQQGDDVVIGVADSGPGMDPLLLEALNRPDFLTATPADAYVAKDPKAQTGLGLALVWEAAVARGGHLRAGVAEEGGALVTVVVPNPVGGRPRPHPSRSLAPEDDRTGGRDEPPRRIAAARGLDPYLG